MAAVILFGALQDLGGWRQRTIEIASLEELKAHLNREDPKLGARLSGPGVFAVINRDMVRGDHPLGPDDEVAFIPPVSGG